LGLSGGGTKGKLKKSDGKCRARNHVGRGSGQKRMADEFRGGVRNNKENWF